MISEPFVINNFLMINQIYPNILFDICSLDCAAKGVLSSCPESSGRNRMQRGMGDMISEPFVTNNFLMINQICCLTSVQQRGMGDMISEPFVTNNFLMINQIYPNILFDICSLDCAAKGVLSSCPESCGRNKCREGWGI